MCSSDLREKPLKIRLAAAAARQLFLHYLFSRLTRGLKRDLTAFRTTGMRNGANTAIQTRSAASPLRISKV